MVTPKQTDPQLKLRLTPEIKAKVEASAKANNRSINGEILLRLSQSFDSDALVFEIFDTEFEKISQRMTAQYAGVLEELSRLRVAVEALQQSDIQKRA